MEEADLLLVTELGERSCMDEIVTSNTEVLMSQRMEDDLGCFGEATHFAQWVFDG